MGIARTGEEEPPGSFFPASFDEGPARRPVLLYGLASTRDRRLRYLGQTRDGIRQAVGEHIADARRPADKREFECSDWIAKEVSAGHRLVVVPIASDRVAQWDTTLRAEVARRKGRGEELLNRPADLEVVPKQAPLAPVSDAAREKMSQAAKRRFELVAGTRG